MGIGLSDEYMYVLTYAGACGVVTHTQYLHLILSGPVQVDEWHPHSDCADR